MIKLFGRREVIENPISAISAFGPSQTDTHKGIGNGAFSSFKKSVILVCKYPEDIKCFSLCLDFFCVLADKLMEETEELCLQREQKEVSSSQASFLQLPCGRAGRLGLVEGMSVLRERGFWGHKSLQPISGSCGKREE